jgi:hypothetical protein
MDFPTAWKTYSIVLTGAFGVLGLLKDFKDKETKRVTKWGYISLVGIVLSTVFGFIAQLQETSNQEKEKAAVASQTLVLAQKADKTLTDINRGMHLLEHPEITIRFVVDADSKKFGKFCEDVAGKFSKSKSGIVEASDWKYFPRPEDVWYIHRPTFVLTVSLFTKASPGPKYDPNDANDSDLAYELRATMEKDDPSLTVRDHIGEFILEFTNTQPLVRTDKGNIVSTLDLKGATLVINANPVFFDNDMSIVDLAFRVQGRDVVFADSKDIKKTNLGNYSVFVYRIPE